MLLPPCGHIFFLDHPQTPLNTVYNIVEKSQNTFWQYGTLDRVKKSEDIKYKKIKLKKYKKLSKAKEGAEENIRKLETSLMLKL